ncbi:Rei1p KNAG_0C01760 [Huiozyma naganishii CBS 8797]|uniref:C2H2-type domain-containing protein n=1 Tax=Huiozyma naganishii (strain ATCC MYA-139 / BCRC 22969 / CBS 8797 / KCTC 17520 / NBRC 10181 / NCYC 3082 / Yp74L-3) TaxID=1071383 RepID=J7R382_HUIN7|nr:hypothetical protein KNAG_0C01760 [Kazachstania naganishii CBS 8797]CCK69290.1 hypothetical protein KNAG_0C01760 [Kazachstania naganishii CBS 8797]
MAAYTCNTCLMEFASGLEQREHMRGDWHRYNLKRRVASLQPIGKALFEEKVEKRAQGQDEGKLSKKEVRRREREALLEKRRQLLLLARQNVLENMQGAGQEDAPVDNAATVETGAASVDAAPEPQTEEELMQQKIQNRVDIPLTACLFCPKMAQSPTFEENLRHMYEHHGFYIPEQKYLVDKEGLVKYISEKIGLGNVCIVCNYQGRSLEAVRAHMLAKRHCKLPYESEDEKLEISEFYDFTASYNAPTVTAASTADGNADGDDDWEDVEGDEEEEDADLNEEYLYNDGTALHLPTGVKVGHRSLQRYFKQALKPEVILTEGQGTLVAADTRNHLAPIDSKQIQTQKRVWQTERRDKKLDDKRSAKFINNQPHYRDQLLQ